MYSLPLQPKFETREQSRKYTREIMSVSLQVSKSSKMIKIERMKREILTKINLVVDFKEDEVLWKNEIKSTV